MRFNICLFLDTITISPSIFTTISWPFYWMICLGYRLEVAVHVQDPMLK